MHTLIKVKAEFRHIDNNKDNNNRNDDDDSVGPDWREVDPMDDDREQQLSSAASPSLADKSGEQQPIENCSIQGGWT